jgi:hypothetical protein
MGRPSILLDRPMTPAERQRRRRAKLRQIVYAADVVDRLERDYARAGVNEQPHIRAGIKKLLRRWERQHEASERWWRKQLHQGKRR